MEEKEFNKKILQELIKVSKEVFYNSEAKEGTYTAAELANGKDNKGNYIYIQCPNREYVICVDSFKCTFRADSVFRLVWRFEQLTRIQAKGKIRYTKVKESNFTCSFYFTLPKQAKALCKVANNVNGIRTNYDCICVDVDKGYLVATDGATIRANETKISGLSGKPQNTILIHKKDFKILSDGLCRMDISEDGATVTDKNGLSVPAVVDKFPAWTSVIPETNGNNRIYITNNKGVYKFLKSSKCGTFSVSGSKGDDKVIIRHEKGTFTTPCEILPFDFSFSIPVKEFLDACPDWDGKVFASGNQEPILFGDNSAGLVLVMPCYDENTIFFDFDRSGMVPYFEYAKRQQEANLPTLYKPDELQTVSYVNILVAFVKSFFMAFFSTEIERTLKRLRELSEVLGIPVKVELGGNSQPEQEANEPELQPSDHIAIAARLHGLLSERVLTMKPDLLGKHAITKGRGSDRIKGIPQPDGVYKTPSVAFIPPETKGEKRFPGVTWRFFFKRGIRIRGSPPHFAKQGNKTI